MRFSTIISAAHLFHKSKKNITSEILDKVSYFTLGSACVLLASKFNEDFVRMKDLVNVSIVTIDRELKDEIADDMLHMAMRQAILKSELLVLRALHFDTKLNLPHQHLLCYLKIIESWLGTKLKNCPNVTKIAISCLQDFYFNSKVIQFEPQKIALAITILTFQVIGLQVFDDDLLWYSSLCDATVEEVWEIIDEIIKIHDIKL